MGEEVVLSFMNIDDYLDDENRLETFRNINNIILEEKDKCNAWKAVVILHSRLCSYEISDLYDEYSNSRLTDDIVLGKFQANDLYSHYYYIFDLVNDVDYRKKRIFDSSIYYYKNFLSIDKILVFDKEVHLKEKDFKDVFDKIPYEVINIKKKPKKLIKKD